MSSMGGEIILTSEGEVIEEAIIKFIDNYLPNETRSCRFKTRLVLSELLANSIIHGNEECREKKIKINFRFDGRLLWIDIKDEGLNYCLRVNDVQLSDFMKESGKGLAIVKEIADEVFANEIGLISVKLDLDRL